MAQDANGDGDGAAAAALPESVEAGAAVAADQTAAEVQAAADKAAAEKLETEKAAAEKVAAEKAVADKAAADKLAAEKLAADQAAGEAEDFHHPNWALAVGAAFLVATVAKMQLFQGDSGLVDAVDKLASGALLVLTALWFMHCFTGDAKRRINDIFVFAYAFTLGSFALLVLPFVSEQQAQASQADKARPASLSLVRGCVRKDAAGGLGEVSAVVLCPYENDKTKGWPDVPKYSTDPASAPRTMVAYDGELRYTLLLAIGGVTATVPDDQSVKKAEPASPGASAPAPKHVEVMGGLVVPFFVLVLAFVGGAVSLSRRIPEYQRRLHPDYQPAPTDKEGKMQPFEAREYVVFQVMQLVSAPFLAVATWYIVTPSGLSSAATLAFGTGFASEPLLLMIRGLVEGIKPEASRPKSKVPDPPLDKVTDKPPGP